MGPAGPNPPTRQVPAAPQRTFDGPAGPDAGGIALREMRWWDIDAVLVLERDLFPDDAWSRGMFWSELAHARGPGATRRYVVAETGGRLVGYAGLAVAGDLADVQTIAVVREQWGTGLGRRLLADLLRHASAAECAEVLLEVRIDNTRAQRMYERFGFEPIGIRRGYYQPGSVDALVMRLVIRPVGGPSDPAPAGGPASTPHAPGAPGKGATDSSAAFPVPPSALAADAAVPVHTTSASTAPPPPQQGPETHG